MTQERLLGMLQAQQEKPLAMLRMLLERQRMMQERLLKALPVKLAKLPKVPPCVAVGAAEKAGGMAADAAGAVAKGAAGMAVAGAKAVVDVAQKGIEDLNEFIYKPSFRMNTTLQTIKSRR